MPPKAVQRPGARKGQPALTIAQIKLSMQMRKAEEERLKREAEAEELRIREEERLAKEQRKFEEEQRARERERQKEEERLKRKDKKSTEKQNAIERMRASGFIIPDVERIRKEEAERKDKEGSAPKKAKPPPKKLRHNDDKKYEDACAVEERSDGETSDSERTLPTESDAEVNEDDWEAMADRDERRKERHLLNEAIRMARREAHIRRNAAHAQNQVTEKVIDLRSPICCILGHVDTGKTSLLDHIRSTNVQGGEAGGITQQIGTTFFPRDFLVATTKELNEKYKYALNVPGLLIIDTPGHESFTNLRNRGSSICDIAILVVDIMHGLEQQTRESLRLLREKKCPFIVALNKVDRLYSWKPHARMDIQQTLSKQSPEVISEFATRVSEVKTQLAMEGFNSELYYDNKDFRKVVSIVPTSAHTGEGISDLILLEVQLVQQFMEGKVTYKGDLQCTVLEVKPTIGCGFTIDVILINGELHEGDSICLCGQNEPIFTQIRSLLTPQPLREMRVKAEYIHHKTVKAAMGVRIAANDLEYVVPGTPLLVYHNEEKDKVIELVMKDSAMIRSHLSEDGIGVTVQSSTLGGLEALLFFLKDMKIQVGHAAIGTVYKRHMHQALSMKRREPRFAVILAFDVVISDEAREVAAKNDITIFEAKIIYHLFDKFTNYIKEYEANEKERLRKIAVFPVRLRIIANAIHMADPIILPVNVERGQLRVGTPLCAMNGENPVYIGKVMSLERDKKPVPIGSVGMELAIKINTSETGAVFNRDFGKEHVIISRITRPSVDAVKKFKDELTEDDINLLATLIKVLKVPK